MINSGSRYLHIGGVVAVGFDTTEAFMLVISHNGRGVFDTKTWERVARDSAMSYPERGFGIGIGPIEGVKIPVVEMDWETYDKRSIASPSGSIQLLCESSGIGIF
jgi:hypothetical protein